MLFFVKVFCNFIGWCLFVTTGLMAAYSLSFMFMPSLGVMGFIFTNYLCVALCISTSTLHC